jgi:multidrug transporter EmrE-like cation transporter
MLSYTGGLVLIAALLHASWNAMLHGNRDRFLSMTWMSIAIATVSTLVVACVPPPARAAWPYIVASGLVHIVYNVSLVRSYRRNDLAHAYPIARGSSPLLVTLGAAFFAHEAIGPLHALGIALISGGILAIALQGSHVSRAGALAALTTGATIALYTVIDGIGVRLSDGQALAYTAWMFLFYWLMPLLFVVSRGSAALWTPVRTAGRRAGVDWCVRHCDLGDAVWRDGRGVCIARDERRVCGADRARVVAGRGEREALASVCGRRGGRGLPGALIQHGCAPHRTAHPSDLPERNSY